MTVHSREKIARFLFPHPGVWGLTLLIGSIVSVWAATRGFHVEFGRRLYGLPVLAFLFWKAWRHVDASPFMSKVLMSVLLFLIHGNIIGVWDYLGVHEGYPLVDARLHAMDRVLGFDCSASVAFVNARPWLVWTLYAAYAMLVPSLLVALLSIVSRRDEGRLKEFMLLLFWSITLSSLISTFLPAAGAYHHLKPGTEVIGNMPAAAGRYALPHFLALHEGRMHGVALAEMTGLITFPSFHAIVALLTTWILRGRPEMWPMAGLNILVLVSTISIGGHYLVDVLAGGMIFAILAATVNGVWRSHMPAARRNGDVIVAE